MPLSFGALMGGICTLLGTSTNILVSGIAAREGLEEFGVFEMTKAGVIFFIAGIIYMISIGTWLIPKRKAHFSVKDSSHLGNYLIEIVITKDFEQINEPFHKQKLFKAYPIEALQILRADGNFIDKIWMVSLVQIILTEPTPTLKQASAARIVAPIIFF